MIPILSARGVGFGYGDRDILRDVPYLNGYFAWALKDYAVRPEWGGGNPDPSPPYSKKGLFDLFYNPKPAALEVEREFKATAPFK